MRTLRGHVGSVHTVAWNPAGTMVATASGSMGFSKRWGRVWNVTTGAAVRQFEFRGDVMSTAWSPCGELLFTATAGQVHIHRISEDA